MTYFEQALSVPKLHFKRLQQIEPVLCNGKPILRRTSCTIESEIIWNRRKYLLSLPFNNDVIRHIEELEAASVERSRGPLISCQILHSELTVADSLGRHAEFDIVLQEIPDGLLLSDAVQHYKYTDLWFAILRMKRMLDAIGFCHNNLRPSNIIVCRNGIICPIRYWHAEWLNFAENNISLLEELLEQHYDAALEEFKDPLPRLNENYNREEHCPSGNIIRQYRYKRYGFVDSEGNNITPYIYTWASEFCEGRAIVARNNKMGVIDDMGNKVIHASYEHIEFDIKSGTFSAKRDGYNYLIDYNGKIIRRVPIPKREMAVEV